MTRGGRVRKLLVCAYAVCVVVCGGIALVAQASTSEEDADALAKARNDYYQAVKKNRPKSYEETKQLRKQYLDPVNEQVTQSTQERINKAISDRMAIAENVQKKRNARGKLSGEVKPNGVPPVGTEIDGGENLKKVTPEDVGIDSKGVERELVFEQKKGARPTASPSPASEATESTEIVPDSGQTAELEFSGPAIKKLKKPGSKK
jgi:hypothetical protein